MLRQTKIVATLGPATDPSDVLDDMIKEGLDVARVNYSHGTAKDHTRRVQAIRERAKAHGRPLGILADLQGPKIRVERFRDGSVELVEGAAFSLKPNLDVDAGDQEQVGVTYKQLPKDVTSGDVLLLDDGNIVLGVETVTHEEIRTHVMIGGTLSNHKGINRKGGGLSATALTEKDHADIRLAGKLNVDYLAVSFARNAADIQVARELLRAAGGTGGVMAKIERAEAMQNGSNFRRELQSLWARQVHGVLSMRCQNVAALRIHI